MKTNLVRKVLFVATLVMVSTLSFAQGTCEIKGKIVNSDRNAVFSATVTLVDLNTNEIVAVENTSKNGSFLIKGVSEGQYILSVAKPGFTETVNRYIMIDHDGQMVELSNSASKRKYNQNS